MTALKDRSCRARRHEGLAVAATVCRPRLFAIHGLSNAPGSRDILGWGMEFPDNLGTVFTEPRGGVHLSKTAEEVLQLLSVIGDVRLTWLDPE
jgi:hypothetical protein